MYSLLFADPASSEVKLLTPDGAIIARTVRSVPIGKQLWYGLKAINPSSAVQRANIRGTWKISKPKLSDTGFAPRGKWLRFASSEGPAIDLAFPFEVPSDLVKALRGIFPQAKGAKDGVEQAGQKALAPRQPAKHPRKGNRPAGKVAPQVERRRRQRQEVGG